MFEVPLYHRGLSLLSSQAGQAERRSNGVKYIEGMVVKSLGCQVRVIWNHRSSQLETIWGNDDPSC